MKLPFKMKMPADTGAGIALVNSTTFPASKIKMPADTWAQAPESGTTALHAGKIKSPVDTPAQIWENRIIAFHTGTNTLGEFVTFVKRCSDSVRHSAFGIRHLTQVSGFRFQVSTEAQTWN